MEATDTASMTVSGDLSVTGYVKSGGLYVAALLMLAGLMLVIRRLNNSVKVEDFLCVRRGVDGQQRRIIR